VAILVDTNLLVYCFRFSRTGKRAAARELLRPGAEEKGIHIPHQALIEFVSVVTRPRSGRSPFLSQEEATYKRRDS